jgi:WD40 repeat protein
VTAAAFGPDGQILAVATADGAVRLCVLRTGAARWGRAGLPPPAVALEFTPDGRHLAAAAGDHHPAPAEGSIHVFDVETGEPVSAVTSPDLVAMSRAFAPGGRHLYTLAVAVPGIEVWDARTGERVRTLSRLQFPATHLALHPDGSRFATAERDGRVRVWDVASGEECLSLSLPAPDVPWRVAFDPDGRRLELHHRRDRRGRPQRDLR